MRRKFDKKPVILATAALALTAALTVGSAMAYFTTYSTASGGVKMDMGFTETIPEEKVDTDGKHITIKNVGDYECFVRVKVFAEREVDYKPSEGWTLKDDGYWYYEAVLPAGESTTELLVTYTFPEGDEKEEFDIVVIQECTPVYYDEEGNPKADWNYVITEEQQ